MNAPITNRTIMTMEINIFFFIGLKNFLPPLRLRSVQAAAFPNFRGGISSSATAVGAKCAVPVCSFSERGFELIQEYCITSKSHPT